MTNIKLLISAWVLSVTCGVGLSQPGWARVAPQGEVAETIALEGEAQRLYEAGRYQDAIAILQGAIASPDGFTQALAYRNLGLIYLKIGNLTAAEQALDNSSQLAQALTTNEKGLLQAQIQEATGQLLFAQGDSQTALDVWTEATAAYKALQDDTGLTRNQLNRVQALRALGLYNQASLQLAEIQQRLTAKPDSVLKAKALQSLGEVLRASGQLRDATTVLQESLTLAESLGDKTAQTEALISLGNAAQLQQATDEVNPIEIALDYYSRAVAIAPSTSLRLQGQLNQLSLLANEGKSNEGLALAAEIKAELASLPPNLTGIYGRINLAKNLMTLKETASGISSKAIAEDLALALQQAQDFKDKRAEAAALGFLGQLYETEKRYSEAEKATEQALILAQTANAGDVAYQLSWQLGRIYKQQKQRPKAIASYNQAVKTLQSLRSDLVSVSSDVQFSFRETVEPVYRELVDLLLQPNASQEDLQQARKTLELLQLAELDNFFRDACLDAQEVQIDQVDSQSAIFYSIILRDRLEVIAAIPGQPLRNYSTPLSNAEIQQSVEDYRLSLASFRERAFNKKRLERSEKLYNWLIRPIEADLARKEIKTLVFIADGVLRNVPMSALYDGEQYLIENYSIAIAPTLNLVEPQPIKPGSLNVLGAGITEARQGFSALPNVELELENIEATVTSQRLLNQTFTKSNFRTTLGAKNFPVVHLATHGQFSSQAEDTFLLTWDGKLNINELNQLLQADQQQLQPLELLVLSACTTAAGDDRAALGLAGMAVRAGARSTLASLWYVSDEATASLMSQFYQELAQSEKEGINRAEAVRRAQLSLLNQEEFSHPYYWSAFILVGNWL
ncbi:MAG: CHAT domain-containing protein [Spirulinaceae cyanobacterium]